jgi:hypothetical protein
MSAALSPVSNLVPLDRTPKPFNHDEGIMIDTATATGNDYVQKPDFRILDMLARICAKHGKLYCYPSHQTIAELVFKFTGRSISTRSLSRHLGALERDGWLARTRRHTTGKAGELELHSTLYLLTKRTVKFCRSLGIKLWNFSLPAAKSLISIALPLLAENLARESQSNYGRPPQRAPRP